jgi:tryptophan-rich sensory protein
VLCLVAVVALGFALVWVRHPARMPFWSGTVLFTVLIVPVVWSMVWHESALPRVAQALTVVCLGLSVLMVGRRYDRRR